jgi:hypothetical protein
LWENGGMKTKNVEAKKQNAGSEKRAGAALLKKTRADAAWNGLSREKQATLEHWLFEERLSYNAALERAKSELGFTGSRTSLRRFYERARSERLLSGLADTGNLARTVEESDVSVEQLRNAGLKLAAEMFLRSVASAPENTKEWAPLAKLLLLAERNESWRRIKEEENRLREQALELARERFQYLTTAKALKALPEQEEPEMTELEENKMVNNIRRGMFGENIPGVLPETEWEQAHPEILQAREKEGYARQMAIYARQREERERERMREEAIKNEQLKIQNEQKNDDESGEQDMTEGTDPEAASEQPVEEGMYYPGGGK